MFPQLKPRRSTRARADRSRRLASDGALSDVIGTIMLIGVTASLVTATALATVPRGESKGPTPRLDMAASGREGDTAISLLHVGGTRLFGEDLRVLVLVDGDLRHDGPLGAGSWEVGERRLVPIGTPLAAGALLDVTIVDRVHGLTLATAQPTAQEAAAASHAAAISFSLNLQLEGGAAHVVLEPPAELLVEATVEHAAGRKFVRFVFVDLTSVAGPGWMTLRDDGGGGDRVAGDGTYSGLALVPPNVTSGPKVVTATAVDFNGTRTAGTATFELLKRSDATEESTNPTQTPRPNPVVPACPDGIAAIASYRYELNGARTVDDLTGNVREGDRVRALLSIASGCVGVKVTLATYTASAPYFSWSNAQDLRLHDFETLELDAGEHVLVVDVPACHFQVSLVSGAVLGTFGPPDTNNYYSRQGRLADSDNGGVSSCGVSA